MLTLTAQDPDVHRQYYGSVDLPPQRNRITLPFGPPPVDVQTIHRSKMAVLTYLHACSVQEKDVPASELDCLRRANEAVSRVRTLFFHGRADVVSDNRAPSFPAPNDLYIALRTTLPAKLDPFEFAGACAYMGAGTRIEFAWATAALLKSDLPHGQKVALVQYDTGISAMPDTVPMLVGADGEQVICDSWLDGPAVLKQHSTLAGASPLDETVVSSDAAAAFQTGYEVTGPQAATAVVEAMQKVDGTLLKGSAHSLVSASFDTATRQHLAAYKNSAGTLRYTTGMEGIATQVRHVLSHKNDERLKQQKQTAAQANLQKAQQTAREFGIPEDHIEAVSTMIFNFAGHLQRLDTSARKQHEEESQRTVMPS